MFRALHDNAHVYRPPPASYAVRKTLLSISLDLGMWTKVALWLLVIFAFLTMISNVGMFWPMLQRPGNIELGSTVLYVVLVVLVLTCIGWAVYRSMAWDGDPREYDERELSAAAAKYCCSHEGNGVARPMVWRQDNGYC